MVENVSLAMIRAQLMAIYEDIVPDAVKTGMLSCRETVETVADFLEKNNRCRSGNGGYYRSSTSR